MKVLEEGNWKNPWSGEYVCCEKSCGAKLLVEEADVKPVDYASDFYFVCSVCGHKNNVKVNELPMRVREERGKGRKYSTGDWD